MVIKTPKKVMSTIQIQRADNGNVIERQINLSQVVQDRIVSHLIDNGFATDETTALSLIDRWRIRTIWIDEPIGE